jgi:hypothetical protein
MMIVVFALIALPKKSIKTDIDKPLKKIIAQK